MACPARAPGQRRFFFSAEHLENCIFCSYIITTTDNNVLDHVSYHRLRCAVDGRVVAARRAEYGAPAAPGRPCRRCCCRREHPARPRSDREEAALPAGHEPSIGAGRPGLHDRHPRRALRRNRLQRATPDPVIAMAWDSLVDFRTGARHALVRRVAQGPRGVWLRPAVRLPVGVQNNRSILH